MTPSTPRMADWQRLSPSPIELGESPFWHPVEQRLYWVDIPGRALLRMTPGQAEERWDMPSEPGCIAPARSGGLVVALRDGIYRIRRWGDEPVCLFRAPHDTRTTRFNDGKCDPLGRFWAGSIYEPRDAAKAELWCVDARDGTTRAQRMAGDAVVANGLAFDTGRQIMYWADTFAHTVWRFPWNPATNALGPRETFLTFAPKPAGWTFSDAPQAYGGRPDGAAVDEEGCYWVALFEGRRVQRHAPDGTLLDAIATPVQCPTMVCLGGEDRRTLFLTTARHNRPADERAALPGAGSLFALRVDTPGRAVDGFID